MFERIRLREVHWLPLVLALLLTGFGAVFVVSSTLDPSAGWGREARMQLAWITLSLGACLVSMHVPLMVWRDTAPAAYIALLLAQAFMMIMAGTSLVPTIKGAHNWIALGSLRIQPSEFYKIATLLMCARLLTVPEADPRRFSWAFLVLACGGLPALLLLREDLGSALTFLPMVLGMLFFAGMRLHHIAGIVLTMSLVVAAGVTALPRNSYHYRRLQAWLDPQSYALTEGYQTIRTVRSVGSGRLSGKGYALGEQNLLGYVPESHTDSIYAVIGEETGFVGSCLALLLFLGFALVLLHAAARCRQPFGRLFIGGFASLVFGQMTINVMVVLGLMPVTGITLPFFSYGGSSMLALYIMLGITLSATMARRTGFSRSLYAEG